MYLANTRFTRCPAYSSKNGFSTSQRSQMKVCHVHSGLLHLHKQTRGAMQVSTALGSACVEYTISTPSIYPHPLRYNSLFRCRAFCLSNRKRKKRLSLSLSMLAINFSTKCNLKEFKGLQVNRADTSSFNMALALCKGFTPNCFKRASFHVSHQISIYDHYTK